MAQQKHSHFLKYPTCPVCLTCFEQNSKGTKFYCSNACRQKAQRDKTTTPMEAAIRKVEAVQKRISTKSQTREEFACAFCGTKWFKSGLEANRMYCDDRCKQAAYRQRVKAEKADQQSRVEKVNVRGFNGLAKYFYTMNKDFKERYGIPMITDGSILYQEKDGYYARTDDRTVAYFATIGVCVKWLQDYFANKRPNMAMLRKR